MFHSLSKVSLYSSKQEIHDSFIRFLGSLGPPVYNTQFDVWKFTEDFFNTFNSLMNINQKQLPNPEIFSDKPIYPQLYPTIPPKKSVFKTFALNDMRPGSKKVFKINDGQGIAFRYIILTKTAIFKTSLCAFQLFFWYD